jgi:large subunit ribosomal protein L17
MLANLASSLIEHGGINTTDARAKALRPFVEKLVTLAKRGDLHARRIAHARLRDRRAVKRLFDEWAPRLMTRPGAGGDQDWRGGYLRILRLGRRKGDSAPISLVQFVTLEGAAPAQHERAATEGTAEPKSTGSEQDNNPAPKEADS